jgi:defect-in-organelle-trafficking protein DotC
MKISLVAGALVALMSATNAASARELSLDQVMTLQQGRSQAETQAIGHVREVVLREIGQSLGARIGFSQRSREILAILEARQGELDRRFDFGRLVIGNNVLPPVISESRDVVSVQDNVLRVAGLVYQIDEPARFALPSPTWRNWLWMGLDTTGATLPELSGSLPANDVERAFWRQVVAQGHELGRLQAQEVFDHNMALLERTSSGMRR